MNLKHKRDLEPFNLNGAFVAYTKNEDERHTEMYGHIEDLCAILLYLLPSDVRAGEIAVPRVGFRMGARPIVSNHWVRNVRTLADECIVPAWVIYCCAARHGRENFYRSDNLLVTVTDWASAVRHASRLQNLMFNEMPMAPIGWADLERAGRMGCDERLERYMAALKIERDLKRKRYGANRVPFDGDPLDAWDREGEMKSLIRNTARYGTSHPHIFKP